MKKYLSVFSVTIKEYFTYRLSFILWRFRVVLNLLIPLFLWSSVFEKSTNIAGYDKTSFISYLMYGNLIATFAFGTRTFQISSDINDGSIVNILLKPVSFFKYHFAREIADKSINLFFAFFEIILLVTLLKLPLVTPNNLLIFIPVFINSIMISYFINLTLSFIGFWTTDVWPIRFIFIILLFFVSGNYFPLDILPPPIYKLILATPFPYFFYLPTKLLIDKNFFAHTPYLPEMIIFSIVWLFGSYGIALLTWKKGIKSFSFWGR